MDILIAEYAYKGHMNIVLPAKMFLNTYDLCRPCVSELFRGRDLCRQLYLYLELFRVRDCVFLW